VAEAAAIETAPTDTVDALPDEVGDTQPVPIQTQEPESTEPAPSVESVQAVVPPDLPAHEVFFTHDENPGDGSRLTYRERLIAVGPETTPDQAEKLLQFSFETIRSDIAGAPPGKFINLAVFDHTFHQRAERPALAALNWKDWRGDEPELTFPLSAPAVVETSYIPAAQEEKPEGQKSKRIPSQELHIGRPAEIVDLNEVLAEVFEAMQDVYSLSSLEDCIAFGVNLAAEKIPCQAATGLRMIPVKEELFCVATWGNGVDELKGKRTPLAGTLAGFAVRQGVAVAISDAANDPRVSAELDRLAGTETRSVLCAPFVYEGRTFGIVELINRQGGDTWHQGEINILSYIAENLSEYIAQSLPSEVDNFEDMQGKP
jgi:hypothetical protein